MKRIKCETNKNKTLGYHANLARQTFKRKGASGRSALNRGGNAIKTSHYTGDARLGPHRIKAAAAAGTKKLIPDADARAVTEWKRASGK